MFGVTAPIPFTAVVVTDGKNGNGILNNLRCCFGIFAFDRLALGGGNMRDPGNEASSRFKGAWAELMMVPIIKLSHAVVRMV